MKKASMSITSRVRGWTPSIATKINGLVLLAVLSQVLVAGYQLFEFRGTILLQRQQELKDLTATAHSLVASEYEAFKAGKQSEEGARTSAAARLAHLRYGNGEYFFVADLDARMVMHAIKPDLDGKDMSAFKDPNGVKLFVEFANAVRTSGSGFIAYAWPRPGSEAPVPKLSHVTGFAPWNWVIGTGVYVDDLDTLFWTEVRNQGLVVTVLMGMCALLSFFYGRALSKSVLRMSGKMEQLAAGNLETQVEGADRSDELGRMARALEVFKATARQNLEMQEIARVERLKAEEGRRMAEQAAIEAERRTVVHSFGTALAKLADKDLTYRMAENVPEAYATLQNDFNVAISTLEAALLSVSGDTAAVSAGAGEITGATDDLARRTEQQAASLEETATALDEITETVKKSADNSRHAQEVVSTAKTDAERAGAVVRRTVDAIGDIEKSSQQIAQIIGVIDEIAFQTNLLALNAGVEAARAGEAGRGFAVVASEVRALAQRSAEAAKEIKALISASAGQVQNGVALVAQTGEALERIIGQVGAVSQLVATLAVGAQEQSVGLSQVNTAINQMDQVTQQNAAMVEETTAASHALNQISEKLATLVGQFRLSGRPASAPAGRSAAPPRRASKPSRRAA